MCFRRWPSGRLIRAWFKPAFPDAHWHEVLNDEDMVFRIMEQPSVYEAMRVLRGLA